MIFNNILPKFSEVILLLTFKIQNAYYLCWIDAFYNFFLHLWALENSFEYFIV